MAGVLESDELAAAEHGDWIIEASSLTLENVHCWRLITRRSSSEGLAPILEWVSAHAAWLGAAWICQIRLGNIDNVRGMELLAAEADQAGGLLCRLRRAATRLTSQIFTPCSTNSTFSLQVLQGTA